MATRELVFKLLKSSPPMTATGISRKLEVKLDSLSSLLKKMCDDGTLVRVDQQGPRGGHVYSLACK